ncbi:MAG: tellurite resistance/C4-dicarboxylate transporter family protein [Solirubrobacterales bacterium]|nr:tellurite resistance/C4-dicarboxylate transporter family protein [Solirubrobacterales bacterium]
MTLRRPHGRPWAGAFNVVMATAIVSIAAQKFGLHVVSIALLWLAVAAFLPLVALDLRRVRAPLGFLRRASAPGTGLPAMGFVADTAVLGTRVALLGGEAARVISAVLLGIGALIWLPLLAAVSPELGLGLFGANRGEIASRARGEWLLGVVATEGLAILAGLLSSGRHSALHDAATVLWALGGLLYLAICWMLAAHLRRHPLSPRDITPDLWILMGGIAIFVVAGATSFRGRPGSVSGLVVTVAWALASAWIPVLAAGELWRATRMGLPRFTPERWTMVFPLGMYSVCGVLTGSAFGVGWIGRIGHWWFAVALAAWVAVALGELRSAFRRPAPSAQSRSRVEDLL